MLFQDGKSASDWREAISFLPYVRGSAGDKFKGVTDDIGENETDYLGRRREAGQTTCLHGIEAAPHPVNLLQGRGNKKKTDELVEWHVSHLIEITD